jgi:copper transporter 1
MDMGGHGMGMGPAAAAHGGMRRHYMHMTFYWGTQSEILFDGWPGARGGGMYALALAAVFALAVLVELLGASYLPSRGGWRAARGAAVHAARVGLAYVLMLALMSFNVGVLLAAVAGHAVGFLLFRGGLCGGRRAQVEDGVKEYLAPAAGC